MQGYLWINWVKLAGALWIIGGKLGSSLIFYFVAIDDWRLPIQECCRNLYSSGTQRVIRRKQKKLLLNSGSYVPWEQKNMILNLEESVIFFAI